MENLKVLLVDDDKFLVGLYAQKFQKAGLKVETALNGQEAIDKIKNDGQPDVLVMDVIMPGLDGIETLAEIRRQDLAKDTIIIMLSNQSAPEDINKAKEYNIDGYLVKATMIPSEVVEEVIKITSKALKKS